MGRLSYLSALEVIESRGNLVLANGVETDKGSNALIQAEEPFLDELGATQSGEETARPNLSKTTLKTLD